MSDPGPFAAPDFSATAGVEPDDLDDELDEDEEGEFEDDEEEAPVEDANRALDEGPADGGTARAVLEHVARSIVDDPDAVSVDVRPQRSGVRLELRVSPSDMGRIIGRRGRVAEALRSLVRAAAAKDGTDATVDIVD